MGVIRHFSYCLLAASLAGCAAQDTPPPVVSSSGPEPSSSEPAFVYVPATPPADTVAYVEEGKAYVLTRLKDPDSAQFRDVHYNVGVNAKNDPVYAVCGEVNARNSYGGYAGFEPFFYENRENGLIFGMRGSGHEGFLYEAAYPRSCR